MTNREIEETILDLAVRHSATVATAESCTGGLVAHRLTTVPGSSGYFRGGVVAYSNDVKERLLSVPREILMTEGAVSEACALAMARGVREAVGAQVGLSTTGIAGPWGATETKPVGLMYVALVGPDYQRCDRCLHAGDRLHNIEAGARKALQMLEDYLSQRP